MAFEEVSELLTLANVATVKLDIEDALIISHAGHEGHDPRLDATDLQAGLALHCLDAHATFLAAVG